MKKIGPPKKTILFIFLIGSVLAFCYCNNPDATPPDPTPSTQVPYLSYSIIATLPHDTSYFTEGLEFYNNTLIEGTGLEGKSKLVQYDPATGSVIREVKLPDSYFGEGVTVLNDTLYQLTWQDGIVIVYTVKDFRKIKELTIKGEGWGLTNDGKQLIASNGSSNLYFYEPSTFRLLRELAVTENGSSVLNINELEYVNGFVYANQWQMNYILKIDPSSGEVVAKLDLTDLVRRSNTDPNNHLNGIAFNKSTNKFYVTGKNWPALYEIQFDR